MTHAKPTHTTTMKNTSTAPNMTREYRKELTAIKREQRGLARRYRTIQRDSEREITRIQKATERALRGLDKAATALERRRLILEGRLS